MKFEMQITDIREFGKQVEVLRQENIQFFANLREQQRMIDAELRAILRLFRGGHATKTYQRG
jgi:hypothetical protein